MKPFTLDTVLRHRKTLEEQAIFQLVKAREEEKNAQAQLDQEFDILKNLLSSLEKKQQQGIEITELARFEQRIILVEKQVNTLQTLLKKHQEHVRKAHELLITRSRERKIMETLQQKQNKAWQQYLNKQETTALDEIAVIFHNRE
jgi:flagellar protein FliJ